MRPSRKHRDLHRQLRTRARALHEHLFEAPEPNRFEAMIPGGIASLEGICTALDSESLGVRVDGLLAVGRIFAQSGAPPRALAHVVRHVRSLAPDADPEERQAALFALGKTRHEALLSGFVEVVADEDDGRAQAACQLLGYAAWAPAVPVLASRALAPGAEGVRGAAIWALGQIGGRRAQDVLQYLLARGELSYVVVGALGDLEAVDALEHLVGPLSRGPDFIRFAAMRAIARVVAAHQSPELRRDMRWMVPELRRAAADPHPPVAVYALQTLAELGQPLDEAMVRRAFGLPEPSVFNEKEAFFVGRPTRAVI